MSVKKCMGIDRQLWVWNRKPPKGPVRSTFHWIPIYSFMWNSNNCKVLGISQSWMSIQLWSKNLYQCYEKTRIIIYLKTVKVMSSYVYNFSHVHFIITQTGEEQLYLFTYCFITCAPELQEPQKGQVLRTFNLTLIITCNWIIVLYFVNV